MMDDNLIVIILASLSVFILIAFVTSAFLKDINRRKTINRAVKTVSPIKGNINDISRLKDKKRRDREKKLQLTDEEAAKQASNITLGMQMEQLFPNLSIQKAIIIAFCLFAIGAALSFFKTGNLLLTFLTGLVFGFGLPVLGIRYMFSKRMNKFVEEFVAALDIIVRGVRSGLVLNDCMQIIVEEAHPIVSKEFHYLLTNMRYGFTLEDALIKFSIRVPLAEVRFFAAALIIQSKSGGNLSEVLSNLANVLRERKRLNGKIKSLSAEAKASGIVIGSLPFGVATMIYITSPNYLEPLFVTKMGNMMLIGAGVWFCLGIFVMKNMASFNKR
jgi:tight adherence protein B